MSLKESGPLSKLHRGSFVKLNLSFILLVGSFSAGKPPHQDDQRFQRICLTILEADRVWSSKYECPKLDTGGGSGRHGRDSVFGWIRAQKESLKAQLSILFFLRGPMLIILF